MKCARLRWYKWVFPGSFFSLNKALFLFFSCFFWGERIPFYLTTTECRWKSVMRVKWSLSFHAGESLEMRVTPAQCGWVHISVFLREFIFSCPMINLFILPSQIAFRLLPFSCLLLNLALFSSVLWVLLIISLLPRLCKTDCQFIMLEIALANWLNKTWVPL